MTTPASSTPQSPVPDPPARGFRPGAVAQLGGPFLRYLQSGVAAAATDFSAYGLLVHVFGQGILLANGVSRPLGGLVCFFLNKYWTFRNRGRDRAPVQFVRFWCVFLISFLLSEVLLDIVGNRLGVHAFLSKVAVEGIIVVVNFLFLRFWTFR